MRFFEASTPYYALLKGEDETKATEVYIENVADIDGEMFDIKEVSRDYALAQLSRTPGEDKNLLPISEVLNDLNNEANSVLLIDAHLL